MRAAITQLPAVLRPAGPDAGTWSAWPCTGDLRPEIGVHNLYTVHITLPGRIDDLDDTLFAIADRLSLFHLMVQQDHWARTRLVLTLQSADLWQAILITINAITNTGYVPVALSAQPAAEFETG